MTGDSSNQFTLQRSRLRPPFPLPSMLEIVISGSSPRRLSGLLLPALQARPRTFAIDTPAPRAPHGAHDPRRWTLRYIVSICIWIEGGLGCRAP